MTTYCGARGRATLASADRLSSRWAVQLKYDGAYAEVHTDKAGKAKQVLSRTGRPYGAVVHQLKGQIIGPPNSILIGEGTWHTEAGIRIATRDRHTSVFLFDALSIDGQDLASEPYGVRRNLLWRAHAELEQHWPGRDWWRDRKGNRHRTDDGQFTNQCVATHWARAPIVEQLPASETWRLWSRVGRGGIEGLVLVNLDAPAGRRRSKLKLKPAETIDASVYELDDRRATVTWNGPHGMANVDDVFTVGIGSRRLVVGDIVEIEHEGFYESGLRLTPRFPRIIRVRLDLREPDAGPLTVFEAK